MKLRYSPTSPYVRKVTVTAIETGLDGRIERVPTTPGDAGTDLPADNPLGKVPALITDGGEALFDSLVICEYLDSLHEGARLFPPAGGARWAALRLMALADGTLDAAVARLLEKRRPESERSPSWMERQTRVVERSLDALEDGVAALGEAITIGHIAQGCLLGFLDFRVAEEDWRPGRPGLAAWFETFARRPSMTATLPADPA